MARPRQIINRVWTRLNAYLKHLAANSKPTRGYALPIRANPILHASSPEPAGKVRPNYGTSQRQIIFSYDYYPRTFSTTNTN